MNEQTFEGFDWSPLDEAFWLEAQKTCGATDLQVRFGCCRHRGMTAAGAARAAGYSGDDESIRQAGSRAAKSTAVMNMLALAKAEAGGGDDGTVSPAEAKRILSRLARGSDPLVRIRALDSLSKIDKEERERAQADPANAPDTLGRLLMLGNGRLGLYLAAATYLDTAEQHPSRNLSDCWMIPHFRELAPHVREKCPEIWARILNVLDSDKRIEAERLATAEPIPFSMIGSGKAAKINGATAVQSIADEEGDGGDGAAVYG